MRSSIIVNNPLHFMEVSEKLLQDAGQDKNKIIEKMILFFESRVIMNNTSLILTQDTCKIDKNLKINRLKPVLQRFDSLIDQEIQLKNIEILF